MIRLEVQINENTLLNVKTFTEFQSQEYQKNNGKVSKNSLVAFLQSIVDKGSYKGISLMKSVVNSFQNYSSAKITKDEAALLSSLLTQRFGGTYHHNSIAAKVQSLADKIDFHRLEFPTPCGFIKSENAEVNEKSVSKLQSELAKNNDGIISKGALPALLQSELAKATLKKSKIKKKRKNKKIESKLDAQSILRGTPITSKQKRFEEDDGNSSLEDSSPPNFTNSLNSSRPEL